MSSKESSIYGGTFVKLYRAEKDWKAMAEKKKKKEQNATAEPSIHTVR